QRRRAGTTCPSFLCKSERACRRSICRPGRHARNAQNSFTGAYSCRRTGVHPRIESGGTLRPEYALVSGSCHLRRGTMQKLIAIALTAFLCAAPRSVAAGEILNVAVPDRGAWDSSYTELGLAQGFFAAEGLDVRITYVEDQAALEGLLASGKVDIAVGAGFVDILGAWAHGAPVRIISPE